MPEPWFDSGSVDELCAKIERRLTWLVKKYIKNQYGDEDDLASQFVARIETAVEDFELKYVPDPSYSRGSSRADEARLHARQFPQPPEAVLTGRKLTFRNENAEEPAFGADILFVFETTDPYFQKKKGLLIQCKDNHHRKFKHTARPDLQLQCQRMHAVTDHSYVLIFTDEGFLFARNPVTAGQEDFNIRREDMISLREVFHSFFECTGGDEEINTSINGEFFEVADNLRVKRTLVIAAGDPHEAEFPIDYE